MDLHEAKLVLVRSSVTGLFVVVVVQITTGFVLVPRLPSSSHILLHCQGFLFVQRLLKNSKTLLGILKLEVAYLPNPTATVLTGIELQCASFPTVTTWICSMKTLVTVLHHTGAGKIRALLLSVTCLSQVITPQEHCFVIQCKDVCGCYRPLCHIQAYFNCLKISLGDPDYPSKWSAIPLLSTILLLAVSSKSKHYCR